MKRSDYLGDRGELPGEVGAHPSASLRDRVTQASPRASLYGESRPSVSTALRGIAHDWRQSLVTIGVLLIWGGLVAIFGGM
jgi:hypothetical protein